MANKYYSKDAWHFQYLLDEIEPRAIAMNYQGIVGDINPIEEEDNPGVYKVLFPGSSNNISVGTSRLLLETGDILLLETSDNLTLE